MFINSYASILIFKLYAGIMIIMPYASELQGVHLSFKANLFLYEEFYVTKETIYRNTHIYPLYNSPISN